MSRLPKSSGRKSGFTLIELLVVIAIIAILAAILFPVFARARENARRSSCQSNEKQIALGFKQYTSDYDEKYPVADATWPTAINVYTKSVQILRCPSASSGGASDIDYLYNSNLGAKRESVIQASALTVLNAEKDRANAVNFATAPSAPTRHFEGSNYAFVDGHVKWLKTVPSATDVTGTVSTFGVPLSAAASAAAAAAANGSWNAPFGLTSIDLVYNNEANQSQVFSGANVCTAAAPCSTGGRNVSSAVVRVSGWDGNGASLNPYTGSMFGFQPNDGGIDGTGGKITFTMGGQNPAVFGDGKIVIKIAGQTRTFTFTK